MAPIRKQAEYDTKSEKAWNIFFLVMLIVGIILGIFVFTAIILPGWRAVGLID